MPLQLIIDSTSIAVSFIVLMIALVFLSYFVFHGIFRVADNQIGVLTRKFTGKRMPQAQVIARHGHRNTSSDTSSRSLLQIPSRLECEDGAK